MNHGSSHSSSDALSSVGENMANSTAAFPWKLFYLMEYENGDVVEWLPHGQAFRVNDTERFAEEIIPRYFKHTKITSFQRQLNLYGFRRISKGPDQGAYFHAKFQRNRKDLLTDIKRLVGKNGKLLNDSTDGKMVSIPGSVLGKHHAGRGGYQEWPLQSFSSPNGAVKRPMNARMNYSNNYYHNLSLPRATDGVGNQMMSQRMPPEMSYSLPPSAASSSQHSGNMMSLEPRSKMSKLSMNIGFDKYMSDPRSLESDPFEWCNDLPRATSMAMGGAAATGAATRPRGYGPGGGMGFEAGGAMGAMGGMGGMPPRQTSNMQRIRGSGENVAGLRSGPAPETQAGNDGFWTQNLYPHGSTGSSGSGMNKNHFNVDTEALITGSLGVDAKQEDSRAPGGGGGIDGGNGDDSNMRNTWAGGEDFLLNGIDLSSEEYRNEFISLMSFGDT